jgi:flagellar FliL protein
MILGLVVLLLAGGGGAYWFFFHNVTEAEAAEAEAEPEPPPSTGLVPLDAFVVNLADPASSRFLRVTLTLVVQDEVQAAELEENEIAKMRVRSAILELLAQMNADALVTPEGKAALKLSIAEGVAQASHETKVTDVLFSEFIVQF